MGMEIRIATIDDAPRFGRVARDVFDHRIDPGSLLAFLSHPDHAIAVAIEQDTIIGFATGNTYLHPDKPVQAWINEVSVAPPHRRRGIAKALIGALEIELKRRGVRFIWLATEHDNTPARAAYRSLGYAETEGIVMYEAPDEESRP